MSRGAGQERDGGLRLAVLVSGSGTNLQALLDRFGSTGESGPARGGDPDSPGGVRIALVVASRGGVAAIDRARRAGVPVEVLPSGEDEEERLLAALRGAGADCVVLAGYLRLVPAGVVRAFHGRMLNLHPALLPAFGGAGMYGERVHRAVLEAGTRVTGVTVHFVDEAYDRGAIVGQWPVPVLEDDDPASLARRVSAVEHRVLPELIERFARGEFMLDEAGRCAWRGRWFAGESFSIGGETG